MVGDFNIRKFLTENQVTLASQHLAEKQVEDSQVTDSVKEFYELQQEMNTMKSRLKEMEARFKGFEGVIKPMLDEMKELGDKLAMAGEFVIKVSKFGGERMDASYKDAFENALSKVNAATKGVLQEALEASKKVTQVKHSIDIQPANQLQEGIMGRIAGAFKGVLAKLDQKVNNAAKAVEDFINLVADKVPGGEDVDDTPNPVLENESTPISAPDAYSKLAQIGKIKNEIGVIVSAIQNSIENEELEALDSKTLAKGIAYGIYEKLEAAKGNAVTDLDEELKGGQKNLDKNKDGKISGDDFKMMKK